MTGAANSGRTHAGLDGGYVGDWTGRKSNFDVSPCGVPKGRVGDYAESHSGLPPQTVFGAFAKSIPKSPNYYAKIAVFCGGLTNA